jgi:hypothetical protein
MILAETGTRAHWALAGHLLANPKYPSALAATSGQQLTLIRLIEV